MDTSFRYTGNVRERLKGLVQMPLAGNLSQLGRSHVEDTEVRLPLDADVCRQEDLGELEGEGRPL